MREFFRVRFAFSSLLQDNWKLILHTFLLSSTLYTHCKIINNTPVSLLIGLQKI